MVTVEQTKMIARILKCDSGSVTLDRSITRRQQNVKSALLNSLTRLGLAVNESALGRTEIWVFASG